MVSFTRVITQLLLLSGVIYLIFLKGMVQDFRKYPLSFAPKSARLESGATVGRQLVQVWHMNWKQWETAVLGFSKVQKSAFQHLQLSYYNSLTFLFNPNTSRKVKTIL